MAARDKRSYGLEFEAPIHEIEDEIVKLQELADHTHLDIAQEITLLRGRLERIRADLYAHLTPSQRVAVARHPGRPTTLDYLQALGRDFVELHGDRQGNDDPAILGGLVRLESGRTVMGLGHQKGHDTKSNLQRNFGMPQPSGFRKALRLMGHAAKFGLPIVTFIDSPGAYPGQEAEERGQGEAIARNLFEMASLGVPIVCVITGEGSSGGALAIGVGDRVLMLEHAYYSVISPEGCAAILWRDGGRAAEAAEALRISAPELRELGVVDEIVAEPVGAAHAVPDECTRRVREAVLRHLEELQSLPVDRLLEGRYTRYRHLGPFALDPDAAGRPLP